MRFSFFNASVILFFATGGMNMNACAQNEILYDPEKGIMFVDKKDTLKKDKGAKPLISFEKKGGSRDTVSTSVRPRLSEKGGRDSTDLHVGRKKDPPTLYFMSGLEYYKNGDYDHAMQNFRYADSVGKNPIYHLWVGKCWRQLGKPQKMRAIMESIIQDKKAADVADDALFEMAAHYQDIDDYDTAEILYTRLAERYPFGESYSTGERYIDVARDQRKFMRAEMSNMLAILGYTDEELEENYRQFQRNHRLKETGVGDQATVALIKKTYQQMVEREKQNQRVQEQARRFTLWAVIAGAAGFLNILLSLGLFIRLNARKGHINEVRQNIAALDVRSM
ncbi:MAG: peptidoglycan-binding protein [Chitinispirillaceae bacterium]|nr:peptidoglycan-binding protein [Chitinispirillaceae bacterium]